jgi:hypothetical protein
MMMDMEDNIYLEIYGIMMEHGLQEENMMVLNGGNITNVLKYLILINF